MISTVFAVRNEWLILWKDSVQTAPRRTLDDERVLPLLATNQQPSVNVRQSEGVGEDKDRSVGVLEDMC